MISAGVRRRWFRTGYGTAGADRRQRLYEKHGMTVRLLAKGEETIMNQRRSFILKVLLEHVRPLIVPLLCLTVLFGCGAAWAEPDALPISPDTDTESVIAAGGEMACFSFVPAETGMFSSVLPPGNTLLAVSVTPTSARSLRQAQVGPVPVSGSSVS